MTAHAELERNATSIGRGRQPDRGPAMRAYCASLSRFTSSVQNSELMLRNDEAGTRDEHERRELTAATRLRGIDKARSAADAGLDHGSTVRADYGLLASDDEPQLTEPGRLRPPGPADLGIALTSLGRRRDELRLAETEFEVWMRKEDERSMRLVLTACAAAGLLGAVAMFLAGSLAAAGGSLVLLIACTMAVVATSLATAAIRRLPHVCIGQGLARIPDSASMMRFGGRIAGLAAVGFVVVNIIGGSL